MTSIGMFRHYGLIGCLNAVAEGWMRRHPGHACHWFIGVLDGMMGYSCWVNDDDQTPAYLNGFNLTERLTGA